MRKYRGKSVSFGWVFGNLICPRDEFYIFGFEDDPDCIIVWDNDGIIEGPTRAVLGETVGQYSGVNDKNGVEMYEGDVVHGAVHWLERFKPAVVTFRNGSFGLLWNRGDIEEFNPFTSMCNVEYEVVGNIYDNPELMN